MNKEMMTVSAKMQTARKTLGLTQIEAAKKAGIPIRSYQNYEAGTRVPNAYTAAKLAQALHSTVEELFPTAPDDNRDTQQS